MRIVRGGYDLSEPWPESLYREAVIILNAEAGYKVTQEEVDEEAEKRRQAMPTTGFVAGRDLNFWAKYIKDGQLDTEAVMAKGLLTATQMPEKMAEMQALGWLEEAPAVEAADTQPLEAPAPEESASEVTDVN